MSARADDFEDDERQRVKRLTRHSLNVAQLATHIKRSSIMVTNKRLSKISVKTPSSPNEKQPVGGVPLRGSGSRSPGGRSPGSARFAPVEEAVAEGVEAEEEQAGSGVVSGPLEDDDVMQMLADSYREVTGRAMPSHMTAEEAYAELRLRTVAAWQGDAHAIAPPSARLSNDDASYDEHEEGGGDAGKADGSRPSKRISMVDSMRRTSSVRKPRLSLKDAQAKMAAQASAGGGAQAASLTAEEWDEDMLEMLKASYREVTGRAMPPKMTPAQAEAELRAATMQTWAEERRDARNGLWAEMIEEEEEEEGEGEPAVAAVRRLSMEHDDDDEEEEVEVVGGGGGADGGEGAKKGAKSVKIAGAGGEGGSQSGGGGSAGALPPPPHELTHQKSEIFRARQSTIHAKGAQTVFEGWLTKHKAGMLKSDRRRWFVLHDNGEVHYFTGPDYQSHKGMFSVDGLSESDIHHVGFLEVGKYGFNVRTSSRLWQLSSESESQTKAWSKNLLSVIQGTYSGLVPEVS